MLTIVERNVTLSHESRGHGAASGCLLHEADAATLMRWVRSPTSSQRVVTRSLIVLLAAVGHSATAIAEEVGVTRRTVALWQRRFRDGGAAALLIDAPGRGRKKGRNPSVVSRILNATRQPPPAGDSRWTARSLASHLGVSHATVHRVWTEHGLGQKARPDAIAIAETPRSEDRA